MPAEQRLDLGPRTCADLSDHRTTATDQNLLLRLGLDQDVGGHRLVVDLLDLDGDRMGHLVPSERERFLTNQLRHLSFDR